MKRIIPRTIGLTLAAAVSLTLYGRLIDGAEEHATPSPALRLPRPQYKSPYACAFAPDGKRLYATFSTADAVGVIDTQSRTLVAEIPVGRGPRGIVVSPDGATAWVALRDEGVLATVDLKAGKITGRVEVGPYPELVTLAVAGKRAWVGLLHTGALVEVDTATGKVARRFEVDPGVREMVPTPDGKQLVVVCDSHPGHQGAARYARSDRPEARSTAIVDLTTGSVMRKVIPDAGNARGAVVTPDGAYAIVAHQRPKSDRAVPGVVRKGAPFAEPETVATGRIFTNGLTLVSLEEFGEPISVLLDEPDRFWADPCGVAWCEGGRTLAVTSAGGGGVLLIDTAKLQAAAHAGKGGADVSWGNWKGDSGYAGDEENLAASSAYVRTRVPVAGGPRWSAVSPDGKTLWCCCPTDDSLAVVDIAASRAVRVPVGDAPIDLARRGERIFHDAAYCGSRAFTCASCHPDGGADGLNWKLTGGRLNSLNTKSLLGIEATAPYGWHGKSATLAERATSTFRRTMGFDIAAGDAEAVAAYLATLKPLPSPNAPGGKLSESAVRGRTLFEGKAACATCHSGPRFTNGELREVGTGGSFKVPGLRGVWSSAPYLHTGKAHSLEDIFNRHNSEKRHGSADKLSADELADVIEYVKSL